MTPVLETRDLRKEFPAGPARPFGPRRGTVWALDGVDLVLHEGEALALVGESGSGKTTLGLALLGLEKPTSGQVLFAGQDVAGLDAAGLKDLRRRAQMVFQDPYETLNPRMSVEQTVVEPLLVHGLAPDPAERRCRVVQALEEVGLSPADHYLPCRPRQLSGGQRQRVAIAAALVLEPAVLVADEPVSMLDVSIRAEILELLSGLRRRRGISVLLITHDLGTAAAVAGRVAVMYQGRLVETGPTEAVLFRPRHPYTQALLAALPATRPNLRRPRALLPGEPLDPTRVPAGCRFHPRCPLASDRCRQDDPALVPAGEQHAVACLLTGATQARLTAGRSSSSPNSSGTRRC